MLLYQLILETDRQTAEKIEDCLMEFGALAVTLQDAKDSPLFEPLPQTTPLWDEVQVIGLFENELELNLIKQYLKDNLKNAFKDDFTGEFKVESKSESKGESKGNFRDDINLEFLTSMRIEPLEDQNWVKKSLDQFKPMVFGKRLWICPSWCELPQENLLQNEFLENEKPIVIKLDPGLAFGTGTHATTHLCLSWLDEHPPKNCQVVDYGSGSGILAIAALKLGAKQVVAIDYDIQARESTKINGQMNDFDETQLKIFTPEEATSNLMPSTIDLILANILLEPILTLMPTFVKLLKPKGRLILSGILKSQMQVVMNALTADFIDIEIKSLEDWLLLHCQKK